MRISKKLNLVIPIYGPSKIEKDEAGKETEIPNIAFYAHSTPIPHEVFEKYYSVIGQAFNQIYTGGLGMLAGSKLAAMVVKDIAVKSGTWDGDDGVQAGLMNEIERLTNIFAPSPRGWTTIPFEEAARSGLIDQDDVEEVRNAAVFFTLTSAMVKKREFPTLMVIPLRLWGGRLESLNGSEFVVSLPKSNGTVSSIAKAPVGLSVPS